MGHGWRYGVAGTHVEVVRSRVYSVSLLCFEDKRFIAIICVCIRKRDREREKEVTRGL